MSQSFYAKLAAVIAGGPTPPSVPVPPPPAGPAPPPAVPRPQAPLPSGATGGASLLNTFRPPAGGAAIAPAMPAGARPGPMSPQRPPVAVPPGGSVRQAPSGGPQTQPPTVPGAPATYTQYQPSSTAAMTATIQPSRPRTSAEWLADPQARYGPTGRPNPAMAFSSGPSLGSQASAALSGGVGQAGRTMKGYLGMLGTAPLLPVTGVLGQLPETSSPTLEAARTFGNAVNATATGSIRDTVMGLTGLSEAPGVGLQWEAPGMRLNDANIPGSYRDRAMMDQHTLGGSSPAVRAAGETSRFFGDGAFGFALGGGVGRVPAISRIPGQLAAPVTNRVSQAVMSRSPMLQNAATGLSNLATGTTAGRALTSLAAPAAATGAAMAASQFSPDIGNAIAAAYPTMAGVVGNPLTPTEAAAATAPTPAGAPTPAAAAQPPGGPSAAANQAANTYPGGMDPTLPTLADGTPVKTPEQQEQLVGEAAQAIRERFSNPENRETVADFTNKMKRGLPVDPTLVESNAATVAQQTGQPFENVFESLSQMSWPEHIALWGGLGLGAIGLINGMSGGGLGSWLLALLGGAVGLGGAASGGLLGQGAQDFVQNGLGALRSQFVDAAMPGQIALGKQQIDQQLSQVPGWQRALMDASNRYLGTSWGLDQGQQQIDQALQQYGQMLTPEQMSRAREQLTAHLRQGLGVSG